MKKEYDSPKMQWIPICSSKAIADVCWAYANNVKPFYYNTYGRGYAELYAIGNSCKNNITFEIRYMPEDMSPAEKALADADMQRVIAEVMAAAPKNPNNFKGSVFSPGVDSSWS